MANSENKYSFDTAILKSLIEQGPSFVMELLRLGMNEAMKVEREQFLNAGAYQRTEARQGHANRFKPKTLNTGSGRVTFAIPQTRNCDFYPQSLQKGLRSERSLTMAMAEIRLFKERPLGSYSVLYVDAEYRRVRMNGSVVDAAVLQAVGINAEGRREVVGMSVSTGEAEVHWRTFFTSLVNRGLHGVRLIWQRCYFHLCQNAQAFARKLEERKEIARTMRNIFSHSDKNDALTALRGAVQYWTGTRKHTRFAEWLENNAEGSMTYYSLNEGWWQRIRTSNCIERLNKEIKKRTKVVGVFPNPESCERLVGSLLMEQHEEWMEDKAYLTDREMEKSAFCA